MCGRPLSDDLRREGDLMLRALVKDLADVPGVEVVATRDARLPAPDLPASFRRIERPEDVLPVWRSLIAGSDAVWPIAPETGDALTGMSELVLRENRRLLGSDLSALRLTTSKRKAAEHLIAHGVPAVPTYALDELPRAAHGWVVKPDDGAGCEDTFLFEDRCALHRWLERHSRPEGFVLQPYVPGPSFSVSILCRNSAAWLLSLNRQDVAVDGGRFRLRGVTVGAANERRAAYARLAGQVTAAIPGLWGYVGIDLVETAAGPAIVDINPRLTTSYVGLHRVLGRNPAALVLDLEHGLAPDLAKTTAAGPVEIGLAVTHA